MRQIERIYTLYTKTNQNKQIQMSNFHEFYLFVSEIMCKHRPYGQHQQVNKCITSQVDGEQFQLESENILKYFDSNLFFGR